jgi:hypothetical protein
MMKRLQDEFLRTATLVAEGFEPITRRMPEMPWPESMPTRNEVVDHYFKFIDRLTDNLHDFSKQLVEVLPTYEDEAATPKRVKAAPKVQAA